MENTALATVLLARPHPFIVSEMTPWLEQAGHSVRKASAIGDLSSLIPGSAGAVVSLAISSSMENSAEDVLLALRKLSPRLPVVFAALRALHQVEQEIHRICAAIGGSASVVGVDSPSTNARYLGQAGCYLYLSKEDLVDAARRQKAAALLSSHLK